MRRSHTAWHKTVIGLEETAIVYNQAYRCRDRDIGCYRKRVDRSGDADGLALPDDSYGSGCDRSIGQQRLREKRTIPEIHQLLSKKPIVISEREVEYLFDTYLVLSASSQGLRIEKYRPEIEANGGVVLAIDGAKPEKGATGTLHLPR